MTIRAGQSGTTVEVAGGRMDCVTLASTRQLLRLNRAGLAFNANQGLTSEGEQRLDPNGTHMLSLSFVHNDDHMRTVWLVKLRGQTNPHTAIIDTTFAAFAEIPTLKVNEIERGLCDFCGERAIRRDDPLYECPKCGDRYTRATSHNGKGRQCPTCAKLGRKVSEHACPACEKGSLDGESATPGVLP